MGKTNTALFTFNRGLVSKLALARIDLERLALSAEVQHNWISNSLGPMSLRPGLEHLVGTKDNQLATYLPFVFAVDDLAKIELTNEALRVLVDNEPLGFEAVATTITNGDFTTDIAGWTDNSDPFTTAIWSSVYGGSLLMTGSRFNFARLSQELTVAGGDVGKVHGIVIDIPERGSNIGFRVGTTLGAQDVVAQTDLGVGIHVISFTPAGNVFIEINHTSQRTSFVRSITMHPAGDLELVTPYVEADFPKIRIDQSGDVIFIGCKDHIQRKLIRRATRSWSLEDYLPDDGPFRVINVTATSIEPSDRTGEISLVASQDFFKAGHVGALLRLDSIGQTVSLGVTAENQFTNPVRVIGVGVNRLINLEIDGVFVATVRLQRSIGDVGNWQDVTGVDFSAPATATYNDGLDNQIVYYRIGVKTGEFTSGLANVSISYPNGTISGIVRIYAVASGLSASASVITDLGSTVPTENWYEGSWSDYRGYPSVPCLHEGRLYWAGRDKVLGSISDAYEAFDDTVEGDSGPIQRSIGSGPVDRIFWLKSLQRMILGVATRIISATSSSLEEPLTPDNFNLKPSSSHGSADVDSVVIDYDLLFLQRSLRRLFELSIDSYTLKYSAADLTVLVPEVLLPGVIKVAVQRQPDTRIHCVRSDGTVAILIYNKVETVKCWATVSMEDPEDLIVDVLVMPGDGEEDEISYLVKSGDNYYLTRWAQEDECVGGDLNKQADLFRSYSGAPISTLTDCDHLNGRDDIVVWADGERLTGTFNCVGGSIALGDSYSNVVAGAYYKARWRSSKLAYASQGGTGLVQKKNIPLLGLILANTHIKGIKYGRSFDKLGFLPEVVNGVAMPSTTVFEDYDNPAFVLPGVWETDARLCLQAEAPMPCTVMAAILSMQGTDKM